MDKNDEMEENPEVKKLKRNGLLCTGLGLFATTITYCRHVQNVADDWYNNETKIDNSYFSDSEDAEEKLKFGFMTEKEFNERIEEIKRLRKKDSRNNKIKTGVKMALTLAVCAITDRFVIEIADHITETKIEKLKTRGK